MLSRRKFLLGGALGLFSSTGFEELVWAKDKGKVKKVITKGPRSLGRQSWPPAVAADFLGVPNKGQICICDGNGRLSLAEMKAAKGFAPSFEVVAELSNFARQVIDMEVQQGIAYLLVQKPIKNPDCNLALMAIRLAKGVTPQVVLTAPLTQFKDAATICIDRKVVYVGGVSPGQENLVMSYVVNLQKNSGDLNPLASIRVNQTVADLAVQNKILSVLQTSGSDSRIDFLNIANPVSPQPKEAIKIEGEFDSLVQYKGALVAIGKVGGNLEARSVALTPAPRAVARTALAPINRLISALTLQNQIVLVGESKDKLAVMGLSLDKSFNFTKPDVGTFEIGLKSYGKISASSLATDGKSLYLGNGISGLEVFNRETGSFRHVFTYKVPRLAASQVCAWGDLAVILTSEFMSYDISDATRPKLVAETSTLSPLKAISGAGSYVLCLGGRGDLSLRRMNKLDDVIATANVTGKNLTFDKNKHCVYVVDPQDKLTRVHCFKVFSDKMENFENIEATGNYSLIKATSTNLIIAGLNDIASYSIEGGEPQAGAFKPTSKYHLDNLAIRDFCLEGDLILATCVDPNSFGFLVVLKIDNGEIKLSAKFDLKHDGMSVTSNANTVVCVGKDKTGADLVSIIDISSPHTPQEIKTISTIEQASATIIQPQKNLAVVVGRGLEVFSLS
ncbi:MAG: hypothetical protein IPG59_16225 [Candidatus Melainabacteria bacterium]|nr:MAG: hypothetical protein IPG59_16225 [Candidatus Melainabacteria bacterium]